jgi:hypothetical protein
MNVNEIKSGENDQMTYTTNTTNVSFITLDTLSHVAINHSAQLIIK